MSESMAFIGGVAVAGLAALLLLKGAGGNPMQNFPVSPQVQQPVVAPPVVPPAAQYSYVPQQPPSSPTILASEQLRSDMERMKLQMDNMQRENDQLKNRNEQLQTQIHSNYQAQLQALNPQNLQNTPQQAYYLLRSKVLGGLQYIMGCWWYGFDCWWRSSSSRGFCFVFAKTTFYPYCTGNSSLQF